ncbi:MAG TPA: Rid family detoxifying hydrolase [Vicinamibacteria bacterium]
MKSSSKVLIALGLALGLALLLGAAPPASEKKAVVGAAKPVGPYSPGVDIGSLVFVAGQIGLEPATGKLVEGGIDAQTTQVMKNAEAVLKNAGLGFKDVVRTTVFLADIKDFQAMNKIYAGYFPEGTIPPARSTVAVAALAAGAVVEIDFIAAR